MTFLRSPLGVPNYILCMGCFLLPYLPSAVALVVFRYLLEYPLSVPNVPSACYKMPPLVTGTFCMLVERQQLGALTYLGYALVMLGGISAMTCTYQWHTLLLLKVG